MVAHQAGISTLVLSSNAQILTSATQDTTLLGHSGSVWNLAIAKRCCDSSRGSDVRSLSAERT